MCTCAYVCVYVYTPLPAHTQAQFAMWFPAALTSLPQLDRVSRLPHAPVHLYLPKPTLPGVSMIVTKWATRYSRTIGNVFNGFHVCVTSVKGPRSPATIQAFNEASVSPANRLENSSSYLLTLSLLNYLPSKPQFNNSLQRPQGA